MAKSDPNSAEAINTTLRGGIAAGVNRGPTQTSYIGMSDATKGAASDMVSASNQYKGILSDAFTQNRNIMNSGGLTGDQRGAIDYTRGVMQGGAEDPAFERLKQNAIDDTRTAINRQFGASGRFGSGGQMIDLGRGLADASASMDYQNLQRRDAAAGNLFNMGQTGQANTFGAIDRSGSLYENTLLPYQNQMMAYGAVDADRRAAAEFDPNYLHLAKYQGLLSGNAAAPQPAKQPGFMDYAMLGGGLLTSFL